MCARPRRGPVLFHKPHTSGTPAHALQVCCSQSWWQGWRGRAPGRSFRRMDESGPGPAGWGPRNKASEQKSKAGRCGGGCEAYLLAGIQHLRGGRRSPGSAPRSSPGRLAEGQACRARSRRAMTFSAAGRSPRHGPAHHVEPARLETPSVPASFLFRSLSALSQATGSAPPIFNLPELLLPALLQFPSSC